MSHSSHLLYIQQPCLSKSREVIIPLYLMTSMLHLESYIQFGARKIETNWRESHGGPPTWLGATQGEAEGPGFFCLFVCFQPGEDKVKGI